MQIYTAMSTEFSTIPVIFGPTAAGKTALSLALAAYLRNQGLKAEIVNADSRQIYQHLPLLTACPSQQEYAQVPHHLFEFLHPSQRFSAADYARHAAETIAAIHARHAVPIVVGGTGLYLKALMEGLSPLPPVSAAAEAEATNIITPLPPHERLALLTQYDATLAQKLKGTDTQRLIRALAVALSTTKPLSAWQQHPRQPFIAASWLRIGVCPPRHVLHDNIQARWHEKIPASALRNEAQNLLTLGAQADWPALKGLAIPSWLAYAKGELSLPEARQQAVWSDNQYAKRQTTWLRNTFLPQIIIEQPTTSPRFSEIFAAISANSASHPLAPQQPQG
jgi:tRNA dimethylallyltransferase